MKRALIGIVSAGILAVTVGVETANAQSYRRYGPPRTYTSPAYTSPAYTSQSRRSVRRGVPPTAAFSNSESPAATGGGSLGYNQNLYNW